MLETTLDITTRDGAMETFIVRPERGGPHPAVLMLMDAPGIREELYDMARRLATVGYYVVLPNLYYRAGRDSKFGPGVLQKDDPERDRMRAVSETEIYRQAQVEADRLVREAHIQVHEQQAHADQYADEVLAELENKIGRALQTIKNGRQQLAVTRN